MSSEPPTGLPDDRPWDQATSDALAGIIVTVDEEALRWRDALAVSIGRAAAMTGLKEHQIRYFEELEVLQPTKTLGASRLYTLADLRRLKALALLTTLGYRPGEAALLVRQHPAFSAAKTPHLLAHLVAGERDSVSDGFLLARLASQLLDVVQLELEAQLGATVQATEIFFPVEFTGNPATRQPAAVQQLGQTVRATLAGRVVAVRYEGGERAGIPAALHNETGRDDCTTLFFTTQPRHLPTKPNLRFILIAPPDTTAVALVGLEAEAAVPLPTCFMPRSAGRRALTSHALTMACHLFADFARIGAPRSYRYRSDGFPLAATSRSITQILEALCASLLPGDATVLAALLIPNSLDQPTALAILAHVGYDAKLAQTVRLRLGRTTADGLSGLAYLLREPFFAARAQHDPRIAYAFEEQCTTALAVPLTTTWGISPFGVLYLASRSAASTLTSEHAYAAVILGSILSELMGRWWLTRLRHQQDVDLIRSADQMVDWLDSLDADGAALQGIFAQLQALWQRIQSQPADRRLTIGVLDIDHYRDRVQRHTNDLLPIRARALVEAVVRRLLPNAPCAWFKSDHLLLVLDACDDEQAERAFQRVAEQVALKPFAVGGALLPMARLSLSYAFKSLSYQAFADLDATGTVELERSLRHLINDLREQTGRGRG